MNRYPHLRLIGSDPLPRGVEHRARELGRAAEAVRRRTGAEAWVDAHASDLCFGYVRGGLPLAVTELPLFRDPCRTVGRRVNDTDVDGVVRTIQRARRVSMERKERIANNARAERAKDADEYKGRLASEVVRETIRRPRGLVVG